MQIDAERLYFVMQYLSQGGEVYYEGRTLVWLDDKTVDEDDKHLWVIDGMAIKGRSYDRGESATDPNAGTICYMGHDMPVSKLVKWVNNLSPVEYQRILRELAKNKEE